MLISCCFRLACFLDGPAHGALQAGDIVLQVGGAHVDNFVDLEDVLDRSVGKSVRLGATPSNVPIVCRAAQPRSLPYYFRLIARVCSLLRRYLLSLSLHCLSLIHPMIVVYWHLPHCFTIKAASLQAFARLTRCSAARDSRKLRASTSLV